MLRKLKHNISQLKIGNCFLSLLGGGILGFGLMEVHSISGITEGGALGGTLILDYWFHISPAVTGFIINVACYLLGLGIFGFSFIAYSMFAACSFSGVYAVCEMFPPIYPEIAQMPLVSAIVGAVFVGVGVGISVRAGGAPTGDDALAMSLARITGLRIEFTYLASDMLVLGFALTYIPVERIIYSLITVVLSGRIIGFIQRAPVGRKKRKEG